MDQGIQIHNNVRRHGNSYKTINTATTSAVYIQPSKRRRKEKQNNNNNQRQHENDREKKNSSAHITTECKLVPFEHGNIYTSKKSKLIAISELKYILYISTILYICEYVVCVHFFRCEKIKMICAIYHATHSNSSYFVESSDLIEMTFVN